MPDISFALVAELFGVVCERGFDNFHGMVPTIDRVDSNRRFARRKHLVGAEVVPQPIYKHLGQLRHVVRPVPTCRRNQGLR